MVKNSAGATDALAAKYLPYLNKYMNQYKINTPERALAFLSQIGHESGGLQFTEEIASGQAYEGRRDLGNTQPGDGVRFKGRGLIGITGRSNYAQVSKALGKDFITNPQILSEPKYATESSAWWWSNRNLNQIADKMNVNKTLSDANNNELFKRITYLINGGYNGLADRMQRWQKGQEKIKEWIKKNPVITAIGVASIILLVTSIVYYSLNSEKIEQPVIAS